MNSHRSLDNRRSLLDRVALGVKIALLVCLVGTLLLGVVDTPAIANLMVELQPQGPLVGIVAGHWQSDSGATCPDGLEEVELTLPIARHVARILRHRGFRVEVLPEYSSRLNGYVADVFLSIHCDSCVDLSGFKLVRMTHSAAAEREDRLVQTLYETYAEATGLEPHPSTITEDMRQYHALRRISPSTPGAILEAGFMGGDRVLLADGQERVALGIANGLEAFLGARTEARSRAP